MVRKLMIPCALALVALTSAGASAQTVEGTYVFPQKIMTSPDGPQIDTEAKLSVTIKGDSAFATWQMTVPGRESKPSELKGTIKGNTITLISGVTQATLRGGSDERTIDVYQEYVLTVTGDTIGGSIINHSSDSNVELPAREISGKRAAAK
jgi:hypothetical protein